MDMEEWTVVGGARARARARVDDTYLIIFCLVLAPC